LAKLAKIAPLASAGPSFTRISRGFVKPKHQRLVLLGLAMIAVSGAVGFALYTLDDTITYFYAPADVKSKGVPPGQSIRLGGLVEDGSVKKRADGVTMDFRVTDRIESVSVRYTGIVPDLFREGQGVVAEGSFDQNGVFKAETLLARHDENYMPKEVADALKKSGEWRPAQSPTQSPGT
jgi:cytochrome c-type biogenesis protein CcmE